MAHCGRAERLFSRRNKMDACYINPVRLIEEVKKRSILYSLHHPSDRDGKLHAWKEVGAAMFRDWDTYDKATAYDRVLQIQKKWRSLRDAYARELRSRRTGVRINRRVYIYFKRMSFLGGFEMSVSGEEDETQTILDTADGTFVETVIPKEPPKVPKKKRPKKSSSDSPPLEEIEMPLFPMEMAGDNEADSDRLFMLSFLPEMRQLPLNIKMWARAQIANIMQEAVNSHYNDSMPGASYSQKLETHRHDSDSLE